MIRTHLYAGLLLSVLVAACGSDSPTPETPPSLLPAAWSSLDVPDIFKGKEVFQPQFAASPSGELLLVWREQGAANEGADLYLARRVGGEFSAPVRINEAPGTVQAWNHDENRAAIALHGQQIAIAWTSIDASVRTAISADDGVSFAPSFQLNEETAPSYRGFVAIAYDGEGALHGVWIDARDAGDPRAEEPADLYYRQLRGGVLGAELILTDDVGDGSVCGCCQPFLRVEGDEVVAAFRNAPPDGYRDIYELRGDTAGNFSAPGRFGPPMWELRGCPSAGPVSVAASTLWFEGSTGAARILSASAPGEEHSVVLENEAEWAIHRPPRAVAGNDRLMLVPGFPSTKVIRNHGDSWAAVEPAAPAWATTGAQAGDSILVAGTEKGLLRFATLPGS